MSLRSVLAALALLAAAPSGAAAAVPQDGLIYSPRNGAELVQAAKLVSALPESPTYQEARIELSAGDYVVSETVVLKPKRPVSVTVPAGGTATITNAAGAPITLLRVAGGPYPTRSVVKGVGIKVAGSSASAFSAVEIQEGADLVRSAISVPASTPNVLGLKIGTNATPRRLGADASGSEVSVRSGATAAPAVLLETEARLNASEVTGGEPTVKLQRARSQLWDTSIEVSVAGSKLTAGPATKHVVDVVTGASQSPLQLRTSELRAGPATTAIVDVSGPTGPPTWGRTGLYANGVTLLGGGHAPGVVIHPGVVGSDAMHFLTGLLQLDAPTAISCADEPGAPFVVGITGVYRDGALDAGSTACTFNEADRRTGDPKFRDRAAGDLEPLVGSSLLDGAISGSTVGRDVRGNPRPSERSCCRNGAPGEDIGAIEYQYTPPIIDEVWVAEPGNRGLVQLAAEGHDESAEEDDAYGVTFEWRFGDGTVLRGAEVQHRLAVPEGETFDEWFPAVELYAYDASGMLAYFHVPLDPWIAECESGTDAGDYVRGRPCSKQGPPPLASSPQGESRPTTPVSSSPPPPPSERAPAVVQPPVKQPGPTAGPAASFELLRSKTRRSARATALATPRASDAAVRISVNEVAKLTVTAAKKSGPGWKALTGAKVIADLPKGTSMLRVTSTFGSAKLKPGVYRLSFVLRFASGVEIRRTGDVRVRR